MLEMASAQFETWYEELPEQATGRREISHGSSKCTESAEVLFASPRCAFAHILKGNYDSTSPLIWQFLAFLKSLDYVRSFEGGDAWHADLTNLDGTAKVCRDRLMEWYNDFFLCGFGQSEIFLSNFDSIMAGTFFNDGSETVGSSCTNGEGTCPICAENHGNVVLLPCRHSVCKQCLFKLVSHNLNSGKSPNPRCPGCRGTVTKGLSYYA